MMRTREMLMREAFSLFIKIYIAVLICGPVCFSQTRQSTPRPAQTSPRAPFLQYVKAYEETPYVTKVILKNGMTVLVDEYRVNPVVSVQINIHVGYFDDPPQSPGMAGLVAGMVQRGAADKSAGSYRQQVQALGGSLRSATDYSTTLFEVVAPSSQWKRALSVQAGAILNPSFDAESAKMEARLLQNEARGILDDPQEFGNENMLQLAFNQERMGKFDRVWRSDLASISPENMAFFYKTQYVPSKMMLVVSGDITSGEILSEVIRLYAKLPEPALRPSAPSMRNSQGDFRFATASGHISTPHLFFGFRVVPESEDDFRALEVLGAIMGGGEGSALSSQVRDRKKLILDQETKLISYSDFGYLSVHAKVIAADIDRSEIAIFTEIELLKREEPTEAEMARALALLERSHWAALRTVTARAAALAHFEYLGDWKRMDRRMSELKKVKPQDVKRVAAKYLRLQNGALLEYLPVGGEVRRLTEEMAQRTFNALIAPSADQEQAERDKQTVLAVKIPLRSGSFRFNEVRYPFQTASILRGPDLFIREEHRDPLIEMGLFFPGGKLDEKQENGGITKLMAILMLRGGPDIRQFYRQLEVYGGQVTPVVKDDYFGFYLSVLSQNFEAAFRLLLETLRAPALDKEEVARQKEILIQAIAARKYSGTYPLEILNQALFEDFSYSIHCDGSEASIASITPETLKLWHESHVRNRKPIAALIGDTKGTGLASIFVQNFSGSRMQDVKLPEEYAKSLEKGKSIDQKWSRSESLIFVGFHAPPEDDEDGYSIRLFEGYTGDPGLFFQELRDGLGIAHRVSVAYQPRLRGGSVVVRVATDPDNTDKVLNALREAIQRVRAGPIPFRDFRSAVNETAGTYAIRQQDRAAQIEDIAINAMAGKGIEGFQNFATALQEVREEDFRSVAQRVFDLGKAVFVVMRGTQ
jgi:zinc protease